MSRKLPALAALLVTLALAHPAAAQDAGADSVLARADQSRAKGAESAPITIIELSDFQCPFCRQFAQQSMAAVDSAFVQTGRARLVFLNFPLPSHPDAWSASEAAMCAGAQGRFWPMHDRLFAEQQQWAGSGRAAELFLGYAAALGLDQAAFTECVREDRVAPLLIGDLMQASRGGVSATPTFVVMRPPRPGEDPQAAQRVLSGAKSLQDFDAVISELEAP
jgi:protein-disulfide isomerase